MLLEKWKQSCGLACEKPAVCQRSWVQCWAAEECAGTLSVSCLLIWVLGPAWPPQGQGCGTAHLGEEEAQGDLPRVPGAFSSAWAQGHRLALGVPLLSTHCPLWAGSAPRATSGLLGLCHSWLDTVLGSSRCACLLSRAPGHPQQPQG